MIKRKKPKHTIRVDLEEFNKLVLAFAEMRTVINELCIDAGISFDNITPLFNEKGEYNK